MNMKSFGFGILTTVMVLLTIGGAYAAFVTGPASVNAASGETIIYFKMANADAAELRDALCHNYGYQAQILDENNTLIPNPQSCAEFGDNKIKQFARDHIMAYRKWQDEQAYNPGSPPPMND